MLLWNANVNVMLCGNFKSEVQSVPVVRTKSRLSRYQVGHGKEFYFLKRGGQFVTAEPKPEDGGKTKTKASHTHTRIYMLHPDRSCGKLSHFAPGFSSTRMGEFAQISRFWIPTKKNDIFVSG